MNSEEFQRSAFDVGDMLLLIARMGGADSIAFSLPDGTRMVVSARVEPVPVPAMPEEVPQE